MNTRAPNFYQHLVQKVMNALRQQGHVFTRDRTVPIFTNVDSQGRVRIHTGIGGTRTQHMLIFVNRPWLHFLKDTFDQNVAYFFALDIIMPHGTQDEIAQMEEYIRFLTADKLENYPIDIGNICERLLWFWENNLAYRSLLIHRLRSSSFIHFFVVWANGQGVNVYSNRSIVESSTHIIQGMIDEGDRGIIRLLRSLPHTLWARFEFPLYMHDFIDELANENDNDSDAEQ